LRGGSAALPAAGSGEEAVLAARSGVAPMHSWRLYPCLFGCRDKAYQLINMGADWCGSGLPCHAASPCKNDSSRGRTFGTASAPAAPHAAAAAPAAAAAAAPAAAHAAPASAALPPQPPARAWPVTPSASLRSHTHACIPGLAYLRPVWFTMREIIAPHGRPRPFSSYPWPTPAAARTGLFGRGAPMLSLPAATRCFCLLLSLLLSLLRASASPSTLEVARPKTDSWENGEITCGRAHTHACAQTPGMGAGATWTHALTHVGMRRHTRRLPLHAQLQSCCGRARLALHDREGC